MNIQSTLLTALSISTLSTAACATSAPVNANGANRQPSVTSNAPQDANLNAARTTAPRIYSFESDANGFNTKTYFYDNGEEVVAFDTQFTAQAAQASIDFLRQQTKHPLTYAVITHPNPDKFNGIATFQANGAKVVASNLTVQNMPAVQAYKQYYFVKIAKMFTDETYPKLGSVDQVFTDRQNLVLKNGETIELVELKNSGVSTNQTIAFIPRTNALFVGDLVHHKAHAWLEGGIVNGQPVPTLSGWIQDLEELKSKYATETPVVYGGRGTAAPLNIAVDEQIQYLERAKMIVANYIDSLGDRLSELDGANAGAHYTALRKIFEREFPDYQLGYMIQYGVYGLVNSIHPAHN